MGVDFSKVVHADERFTHHRPLVAGDVISAVVHIENIVQRAGISMVTTRAELTDAAGKPVSTVYVDAGGQGGRLMTASHAGAARRPPVRPAFAGLAVGDVVATREVAITRDTLVRYAGASGDFNPIHYNDVFAQ